MNGLYRNAAVTLLVLLVILVPGALPAQDRTEWLVAPYGWLPDISLSQSGGDDGGIGGVDLLDKTDAVGMIRLEAAQGRWGLLLDYIFLDLADSSVIQAPGDLVPDIGVRAELDLTVVEFGAVYRANALADGVHYLIGYRGIDADETLLVTPDGSPTQRRDTDSRLSDVFVGARYIHRLSEAWAFTLRGDYSAGESEGVLNLLASIGYRFPGPLALQAGYRYADLRYEEREGDGQVVETEIELSGAFVGLVFRF